MPIPRKVLIRVIGAPLLVAALCGLNYWGHLLQKRGQANTPLSLLLLVVAFLCGLEFYGMCRIKGVTTASCSGLIAITATFVPWTSLGLGAHHSVGLWYQVPLILVL